LRAERGDPRTHLRRVQREHGVLGDGLSFRLLSGQKIFEIHRFLAFRPAFPIPILFSE
jgi:hypothetical protein